MGWRTVLISGRAKLDLKLNNMIVRKEEIYKIHIPEIAILIIESTTVSITTALIESLIENKVKIIFSGSDHCPIGEIINYYNKFNCVASIKKQIKWKKQNKEKVWAEVVKFKIFNQARVLSFIDNDSYNLLTKYIDEVELGDISNREGHAAKVYFNTLFGKDFSRGMDHPINAMLNFGYSILLSIFTREIVSMGYLTQLGIFHDNQFNYYNLASDFMEILRPIVDNVVFEYMPQKFDKFEKSVVLNILEKNVKIEGINYTFLNSITVYCKSLFEAIETGDISLIKFIDYEL
ncbi:type II CRISPR-associated endonuclease Cas1 [Helcococcus ovis]|uniref:CRISPR-associated endonuclease Cas1 n=1 Tax=Helcococcus ovis TaxID=72026 RepID=A0A4R9C153_9FIRM|nr:type II CRISPR-associated endonuclease Cas1 [Helcococcus ovis]TFF64246.1 type II CRISPR-associated endonuclease Cas1 [Helcococcus ovis]TFF65974.1 type II CRISPR-associated endonuclease Cas1 [Helcococcus ovis]TFF68274.1 type II CRISPR-associated endonuclease Cas1 [Helcococcus ovis]WNZ00589.1 type II CRISPR-associated endonuclease Cas1 [Helcococcus ovis]